MVDLRSRYASLQESEPVGRPLVRFFEGGRYLGTPFFTSFSFSRGALLIVAQRQSTLLLDCHAGRGPTWATLAVKRGAPSITLDIHLKDS
jgi:hypothetical protein